MNFALGVEITLFSRSFTVSRLAVGVLQSMSTVRFCPTYVSLVLLVSSFCWQTLHTILAFATSGHFLCGTLYLFMKNIVLVPVLLPGMPCANRPILLPNEYFHSSFSLGCLIKCRYSSSSPASVSKTESEKFHKKVIGYLCCAVW